MCFLLMLFFQFINKKQIEQQTKVKYVYQIANWTASKVFFFLLLYVIIKYLYKFCLEPTIK